MDVVERSVRSWIVTGKDAEVEKLVVGISSDSVTFLDIVKVLGEYLTSEEDHLRTKGVQILSLVIERCPREKLNRQAVRVLVTFYCSKLEGTETVTPALHGLSHLVTFPSFSSLEVSDVVSAVFQHVKMKSLVQSTRFHVYNIINALVDTYRDYLKSMGEQFLSGYAALASGEQDPRNLLIAFKIARVILAGFDISKHVETYFDITFCYYPIVFRPPPDDPYGIDVDNLKVSLRYVLACLTSWPPIHLRAGMDCGTGTPLNRACLSATPVFGSLGIPLFLEKLSVAPPSTKRDVLQTMAVCFPVYGINIVREFGRNIWSALKLEIFQPTDPLTEEIALNTLRVFVRVLSSSSNGTDDDIDMVLRVICTDCLGFIGEPEKVQAKAGTKVLRVLVDIPSNLGNDAINDAIEKLIVMFHDPGEVSNRAAVIMLLNDLLSAFVASVLREPSTMMEQALEDIPSLIHTSLTTHKDAIMGMLIVGLKSSATRLPAISGLSNLIRLPALLTDTELGYIVLEAGEFARKEPDEVNDVTTDVLSLLSSIALMAPHHIANQTLPSLLAMLPEQAPSRDAQLERTEYWRALCVLSKLCVQPTLFEILVIRLTAKLELLCSLSVSQRVPLRGTTLAEEDERNAAYAHALLLTLANTLSAKVSKAPPDPDVPKYVDQLLSHLFRLFLGAAVESERRIMQDQRLLRVGEQIVKSVVEALSIEQQQRFIDGMDAAFLHGQVKAVTGGEFLTLAEFKPIHVDASAHQRETVILFAAAHVPIRKEVSVMKNSDVKGVSALSAFLRNLVRWCDLSTCSALQRGAASKLFATLVNKYADDISDFLNEMLTSYFSATLINTGVLPDARRKAIDNWVWISRGLVVRSHPLAMSFIDSLLALLDDETIAWDAARALGILVADDGILTKRNNAILKILHVQKCFSVVLPKVIDGANKVDGTKRETAYLIALASLVRSVPKSLYATQIPTLMPLLLRGLEAVDPDIRWQIIETFSNNVGALSDDTLLSTYASTLVIAILKNCTVVDMPEHKVRVAALKYLSLLPSAVRYDLLHPHKPRVLRDLAKALDDPKRAVRKAAVNARTKWYKYSG